MFIVSYVQDKNCRVILYLMNVGRKLIPWDFSMRTPRKGLWTFHRHFRRLTLIVVSLKVDAFCLFNLFCWIKWSAQSDSYGNPIVRFNYDTRTDVSWPSVFPTVTSFSVSNPENINTSQHATPCMYSFLRRLTIYLRKNYFASRSLQTKTGTSNSIPSDEFFQLKVQRTIEKSSKCTFGDIS